MQNRTEPRSVTARFQSVAAVREMRFFFVAFWAYTRGHVPVQQRLAATFARLRMNSIVNGTAQLYPKRATESPDRPFATVISTLHCITLRASPESRAGD